MYITYFRRPFYLINCGNILKSLISEYENISWDYWFVNFQLPRY